MWRPSCISIASSATLTLAARAAAGPASEPAACQKCSSCSTLTTGARRSSASRTAGVATVSRFASSAVWRSTTSASVSAAGYPFDQFIGLAKANGQLMIKLSEIARASGEAYLRIGASAASSTSDQTRAEAPGATTSNSGGLTYLSEIEKANEAAIASSQAAIEDWQNALKDIVKVTE